jgi:DNA invertase Pin-like site-specific DNA recombinase
MERKKANGYIRVEKEDRNAIDDQKRNIENAVFQHKYELIEIYIDTGSGATLERDGIKKLIHDTRNSHIDTVLVSDTDVLSTDSQNTSELLETLSTLNVRVYSVSDKRFLNTPTDTLNNLSRKVHDTLFEMEQNGINLQKEIQHNEKLVEKDPSARLQNEIIEAYLRMNIGNRPQI